MAKQKRQDPTIAKAIYYKAAFGTEQGKRVLVDLLSMGGIFDVPTLKDQLLMAYSEGRRSIVLEILQYIDMDIDKLRQAIEEEYKKQQIYEENF